MTRKRATRAAAWITVAGVLSALTAGAASAAETAVGLTNANPSTLVTFPVGNPGAATPATINFPNVDGGILGPDTNLIGLDHRPRGGGLYAQATRGTLYVLTPAAAAGQFNATAVNVTPVRQPLRRQLPQRLRLRLQPRRGRHPRRRGGEPELPLQPEQRQLARDGREPQPR